MRATSEEQQRRRPRMLTLYSKFIRAGDLVFDVGANHGDRSQLFLDLGARVVAVEPQPHCAEIMRRRFRADPRIDVLEAALDERQGNASIRLSDNDLVSSMSQQWIDRVRSCGRFDDSRWQEEMEVPTITMDALIARYGLPRFTKIDTEGYELQVFKGLSDPLPALSFEYTPEYIEPAVGSLRLLSALGSYLFNLSVGESMELGLPQYVQMESLASCLEALAEQRGQEESGDVYAVLEQRQDRNGRGTRHEKRGRERIEDPVVKHP
ncbi:MAG: FkbM family methyltransferase [Methanomassiliicoccus sp.]|nr:FkbM family methyltransferase [Methanomassiliicoccus sp.]